MKKQILSCKYWLAVLVTLFTVAGCVDDEVVSSSRGVIDENGMVSLTVQTQVPGLKVTRAVDGDGERISSLWLLAFDEKGYMLSRVQAAVGDVTYDDGDGSGSGTFSAQVPATTRRIHFLANVIMDNFNDAENIGRHENEVIAPMVSSSGDLVYWGRETFADEAALLGFAGGTPAVTLYRNQALVRYAVGTDAQQKGISVKGWAFCNEYAYGTVAPFDTQTLDDPFHFDLSTGAAATDDFVTLLPEQYNVKMTDPTEATVQADDGNDPRYVFENPNREDDQMYVIMLIASKNYSDGRYYKVLLIDDNKEPLPIIRNHQITVTVNDINENYGVDSFEAAKTATPVNNPWISISDEIPEINNGNTTLRIEGETTVIYQEAGMQTIEFYYNGSGTPTVEWLSNNGISSTTVLTPIEGSDDMWTVTFITNEPDDEVRRGMLEIRETDGVLSRRVTVVLCRPFEFTPVWISSEIPLLTGEYVTVLFNIPDDFPQELLPINVKFGSDLIDAMPVDDGGQQLEVVMEETNYGGIPIYQNGQWTTTEPNFNPGFDYKYVYSATSTGQHYVQFRTVLTDLSAIESGEFFVYMEGADSRTNENIFQTRRLFFAFQDNDAQRRILLQGGDSQTHYASRQLTTLDPVAGEEISIPFILGTLEDDTFQDATFNGNDECQVWVYYDPSQVEPTGDWAGATTSTEDYYGNTYVTYTARQAVNTITFRTLQPAYNTNIVLSARSIVNYGQYEEGSDNPNLGVNTPEMSFRSASVEIRSQGALDFNPQMSVNDGLAAPVNGSYELPYGEGQTVDLIIDIPEAARDREFTLRLGTANLEPVGTEGNPTAWANGNGYDYTINTAAPTFTLHLRTTRVVNAETLTLESGPEIGFNSETIRLTDRPLTGTIVAPADLPFERVNPNIILERQSDGARIGTFDPDVILVDNKASQANYSLTLRGEYNLHLTDRVTVRWSPAYESNDVVCTYVCTLADLLGEDVTIYLEKQ